MLQEITMRCISPLSPKLFQKNIMNQEADLLHKCLHKSFKISRIDLWPQRMLEILNDSLKLFFVFRFLKLKSYQASSLIATYLELHVTFFKISITCNIMPKIFIFMLHMLISKLFNFIKGQKLYITNDSKTHFISKKSAISKNFLRSTWLNLAIMVHILLTKNDLCY